MKTTQEILAPLMRQMAGGAPLSESEGLCIAQTVRHLGVMAERAVFFAEER